ncbi:TPA: NUDIX domain-containing protein [Staphylococcus aureus]|nr:NUDIX domain-containing protein [Staphylococcus aureus]
MQKTNLIPIFDRSFKNILMCKRVIPPFKNMYNFIGGKVEESESIESSVYREMLEETSLTCDDVILHPIMDITYYQDKQQIYVYSGVLNKKYVPSLNYEQPLYWIDLQSNFNDLDIFAGNGNLNHIINQSSSILKRRVSDE